MAEKETGLQEINKRAEYERLCEGEPNAFYILSGGILLGGTEENPRYRSNVYSELDYHGYLGGGKARSIAAAEMAKYLPGAKVIANSWVSKDTDSDAKVMAREIEHMGIQKERIILQENSYSTFTEMIELLKIIEKNNWHHVAVVTNEFQIPRAKAMLERMDTLHDPNGAWQDPEFQKSLKKMKEKSVKIVFVSAEEVLPIRSKHYTRIVEEAKTSDAWKKRVEVEMRGVKQLEDELYWKNLPSTFVKPEK